MPVTVTSLKVSLSVVTAQSHLCHSVNDRLSAARVLYVYFLGSFITSPDIVGSVLGFTPIIIFFFYFFPFALWALWTELNQNLPHVLEWVRSENIYMHVQNSGYPLKSPPIFRVFRRLRNLAAKLLEKPSETKCDIDNRATAFEPQMVPHKVAKFCEFLSTNAKNRIGVFTPPHQYFAPLSVPSHTLQAAL